MSGRQRVSKFKDTVSNIVEVHMALLRLPQFTADILVTFNNPLDIRLVVVEGYVKSLSQL